MIVSEELGFVKAHPLFLEKVYYRWFPLTLEIAGIIPVIAHSFFFFFFPLSPFS